MLSYQRPRVINKIIQQFCVFIFAALAITGCFHDDDDDDDDNGSKQAELMMLDFAFTGEQESPSVATDASGNGSMEINLDSGAISGSVSTDLENAMMAHIHQGFAGQNGPVLIGLEASGATWNVPANAKLSASEIEALLAGELYVNVHTEDFPGGELRAQLIPEPLEVIRVPLTGDQEIPPVITENAAVAAITLDHDSRKLTLHLLTMGLDDADAAHIHSGFPGANGAPIITLTQDDTDVARWFVDTTELSQTHYDLLMAGGLYINVHTHAYPDGEVRGQIVPDEIVPLPSFQVSGQIPSANATIIELPAEILLDFNAEVDGDSVMLGVFEVLRAGGDMSFTEGNEILINIASALIPAENPARVVLDIDGNEGPDDLYQVSVSDSIQSVDGRVLDGDGDEAPGGEYQRSFTIVSPGG